MATADTERPISLPTSSRPRSSPARRPRTSKLWLPGILIAVVGAAIVWGGDALRAFTPSSGIADSLYQTYTAQKGLLRITVTEDGNVESASNIDLKCQVEGGSQILWIISEGTQVTKGTELVKLSSAAIEDQITQQKILFEKARSTLIQAEEDYAVASIAVKEYVEGRFLQELQLSESNVVIAEENLKSAQNMLDHSQKMYLKGYINQLQLETNRFSVQRSQLELDAAKTARRVLVDYTKSKTIKELEAAREAAHARMLAEKSAAELEKGKLDRLTDQLKRCVIVAPQDGMVIYANDSSGGRRGGNSQTVAVEEGAMVREFQSIILLPDLKQMQVKALVHETKVNKIRPGMKANIRIRDMETQGTVSWVASQPEPGSWFSSSVKEYATLVRIDDTSDVGEIKPGMTAEVEIVAEEIPGAIGVPLLGVVQQGAKHFCFVRTPLGYEKREVVVGLNNDRLMEIKDGLAVGDQVILNPRASIPEARAELKTVESPGAEAVATESAAAPAAKVGLPAAGALPAGGALPAAPGKDLPAGAAPAKKASGNIMSFDKDKDGKVSKAEAPETMQRAFTFMDTNGDGSIDSTEAAEAQKRRLQREKAAPAP